MEKELNYPIIVFSKKDNMAYVYYSSKDFKSTSEELFKIIDYTNLEIVDRLGYMYKINKAFKIKYLGLWGFFNPLLKGRQILVDFDFSSEVQNVALEDFKKEIIRRIENKKSFGRQVGISMN